MKKIWIGILVFMGLCIVGGVWYRFFGEYRVDDQDFSDFFILYSDDQRFGNWVVSYTGSQHMLYAEGSGYIGLFDRGGYYADFGMQLVHSGARPADIFDLKWQGMVKTDFQQLFLVPRKLSLFQGTGNVQNSFYDQILSGLIGRGIEIPLQDWNFSVGMSDFWTAFLRSREGTGTIFSSGNLWNAVGLKRQLESDGWQSYVAQHPYFIVKGKMRVRGGQLVTEGRYNQWSFTLLLEQSSVYRSGKLILKKEGGMTEFGVFEFFLKLQSPKKPLQSFPNQYLSFEKYLEALNISF